MIPKTNNMVRSIIILIVFTVSCYSVYPQELAGTDILGAGNDEYLVMSKVVRGYQHSVIRVEMEENLFIFPSLYYLAKEYSSDIYLPGDFKDIKFDVNTKDEIYIAGILNESFNVDSNRLFLTKIDDTGKNMWTINLKTNNDSINIFLDKDDNIYLFDYQYFYKFNPSGEFKWVKEYRGIIKYNNNRFYNLRSLNQTYVYPHGIFLDSLILNIVDTSGTVVRSNLLINTLDQESFLTPELAIKIISGKVYITGKYWGNIDVDPSNEQLEFSTDSTYKDPQFFTHYVSANYLTVYDTLCNLVWANSKELFPDIKYICTDSYNSIYMAGPANYKTDYCLISGNSTLVSASSRDYSFFAKYTNDYKLTWVRIITGRIKHLGISYFRSDQIEKLDLAGDFEGTINLDIARPNHSYFGFDGRDVFFARYTDLDNPLSITSSFNIENNHSLKMYPTPSSGIIYIHSNKVDFGKIMIYDLNGKLRYSDLIESHDSIVPISLLHLSDGLYIIKFITKSNTYSNKIILKKQ